MKKIYICMLLFIFSEFPLQAKSKVLSIYVSNESNHALAGVALDIFKDNVLLKTLVSNKQGYVLLSPIDPGYYTIAQKQAMKNYELPKAYHFQVDHNFDSQKISFKNKRLKGKIRIIIKGSGKQPLPFHNVTLINDQKQTIQEKKSDQTGAVNFYHVPIGHYKITVNYRNRLQERDIYVTRKNFQKAPLIYMQLKDSAAIHNKKFDPSLLIFSAILFLCLFGLLLYAWKQKVFQTVLKDE